MSHRGALIVLEGCDRAGKTTQCKLIVETLRKLGHKASYMNFPNRASETGKLIDAYLSKKQNLTDEGIHLLFSANRWEEKTKMTDCLLDGTTLIVDRYSYSGVAFTAAKGLNIDWCKSPEKGLLKPDLVLYLTLTPEEMQARGDFGNERYEIPEFQKRVMEIYDQLFDVSYWKKINAGTTQEKLQGILVGHVEKTIQLVKEKPLLDLW